MFEVWTVYEYNYEESRICGVFGSEAAAQKWIEDNAHCQADKVNMHIDKWEVQNV